MDLALWDAAYSDAYGPTYSTKKAPALSRVPRGHWRNVWRTPNGNAKEVVNNTPGCTFVDAFHYLGSGRHPSREIAEQRGIAFLRQFGNCHDWIDAEFFPEA